MTEIVACIVGFSGLLVAITKIFEVLGRPIQILTKKKKSQLKKEAEKLEKREKENITNTIQQIVEPQFQLLITSSKDLLRISIIQIYEENKKNRTLTFSKKQMLDDLYKDYKAEQGNNYITFIYDKMLTWNIIPDDE